MAVVSFGGSDHQICVAVDSGHVSRLDLPVFSIILDNTQRVYPKVADSESSGD